MAFASKLMHYGNYSYLGFENSTVKNVLKGIFPVANSPLSQVFINENIDWSSYIQPSRSILFDASKEEVGHLIIK